MPKVGKEGGLDDAFCSCGDDCVVSVLLGVVSPARIHRKNNFNFCVPRWEWGELGIGDIGSEVIEVRQTPLLTSMSMPGMNGTPLASVLINGSGRGGKKKIHLQNEIKDPSRSFPSQISQLLSFQVNNFTFNSPSCLLLPSFKFRGWGLDWILADGNVGRDEMWIIDSPF